MRYRKYSIIVNYIFIEKKNVTKTRAISNNESIIGNIASKFKTI